MTREEAEQKAGSYISRDYLINAIYDDIESRTCENCKYGNDLDLSLLSCTSMNPQTPSFCTIDFGCNKFERKDHE